MKKDGKFTRYFVIWASAILVVCIVYGFLAFKLFCTLENSAKFGDSFGALNAVFTGLAFAGVIITFHIQRRQFETQIEDMLESKAIQLRITSAQEETAKIQREISLVQKNQAELNALSTRLTATKILYDVYNLEEQEIEHRIPGGIQRNEERQRVLLNINVCLTEMEQLKERMAALLDSTRP